MSHHSREIYEQCSDAAHEVCGSPIPAPTDQRQWSSKVFDVLWLNVSNVDRAPGFRVV